MKGVSGVYPGFYKRTWSVSSVSGVYPVYTQPLTEIIFIFGHCFQAPITYPTVEVEWENMDKYTETLNPSDRIFKFNYALELQNKEFLLYSSSSKMWKCSISDFSRLKIKGKYSKVLQKLQNIPQNVLEFVLQICTTNCRHYLNSFLWLDRHTRHIKMTRKVQCRILCLSFKSLIHQMNETEIQSLS